jgi:orotate phosphoribosyltransferase
MKTMTAAYQPDNRLEFPSVHSDRYVFVALALMNEQARGKIAQIMAKHFEKDKMNVVAGYNVGGVLLGYEVGNLLGAQTVVGRETEDGKVVFENLYKIKKGDSILLVDDVLITERPIKEAMATITGSAKGVIKGVGIVVNCREEDVDFGVKTVTGVRIPISLYEVKENKEMKELEHSLDSVGCPMCRGLEPIKDLSRVRIDKSVALSVFRDRERRSTIAKGFEMYEKILEDAREDARKFGNTVEV